MINAEEAAQHAEELCNELFAAVGYNMGGDPVMVDPPIEKRTGTRRSRHGSQRDDFRQF